MGIVVNIKDCIGCGTCEEQCPGDVIRMDPETNLPFNKYPDECWYCGTCEIECPTKAAKLEFPYLIK